MRQKKQVIVRDTHFQGFGIPADPLHPPQMSMTRVAIAGTGGLAYLIAHYIHSQTSYPLIILAKEVSLEPVCAQLATTHQGLQPNEALSQKGLDIHVVNYNDPSDLYFALLGITVVISTIPGTTQISLINAAISAGVSRFAPAEFEGLPSLRPNNDELDCGKAAVIDYLFQNQERIEYTCFVCGILYEHFAPDGLYISSRIGHSSPISDEGDYLMNLSTMYAELPHSNAAGTPVRLRLTAGQDVGKFVARAIALPQWPPVLSMSSERLTTRQLLSIVENVRGKQFYPNLQWRDDQSLHSELALALAGRDTSRYTRLLYLLATQEGRFDFDIADLNGIFSDIQPLAFSVWLDKVWNDNGGS